MLFKEKDIINLPSIFDGTQSFYKVYESCEAYEEKIDWVPMRDEARLACRVWRRKDAGVTVLYLHGIEGHSQWFRNTALALNSYGINVYAPDRRGSGLNRNNRGHLGSAKQYLSDIELFLQYVRKNHPNSDIVLVANCWSAKAAAIIASLPYNLAPSPSNLNLSGLVLTSPAIYTKVDLDLLTKFKLALSLLDKKKREQSLWPIPLSTGMLTDNRQFMQFLENDPLRLKQASSSFFFQTFLLSRRAQKAAHQLVLPVLILQAGCDQIVDIGKVQRWFERLKSPEKTMRIFPRVSHSLDFDPSHFREYVDALANWILDRAPLKSTTSP